MAKVTKATIEMISISQEKMQLQLCYMTSLANHLGVSFKAMSHDSRVSCTHIRFISEGDIVHGSRVDTQSKLLAMFEATTRASGVLPLLTQKQQEVLVSKYVASKGL